MQAFDCHSQTSEGMTSAVTDFQPMGLYDAKIRRKLITYFGLNAVQLSTVQPSTYMYIYIYVTVQIAWNTLAVLAKNIEIHYVYIRRGQWIVNYETKWEVDRSINQHSTIQKLSAYYLLFYRKFISVILFISFRISCMQTATIMCIH